MWFANFGSKEKMTSNTEDETNASNVRRRRMVSYYAVRGGETAGVYDDWGDAVNAGYMRKQGHGNAVKFDTREAAERFVAHRPFAEGTAGRVQGWVQRQHFLFRASLFAVTATTALATLFNLSIWARGYFECNKVFMSTTNLCMGLTKLSLVVSNHMNTLVDYFMYEVIAVVGILVAWMVGFLG